LAYEIAGTDSSRGTEVADPTGATGAKGTGAGTSGAAGTSRTGATGGGTSGITGGIMQADSDADTPAARRSLTTDRGMGKVAFFEEAFVFFISQVPSSCILR